MSDQTYAHIQALYAQLLHDTGKVHLSEASRNARYNSVLRAAEVHRRRILDVGCGLGGLVQWLHDRGKFPTCYHGLDVTPEVVAKANELLPKNAKDKYPTAVKIDLIDDFLAYTATRSDVVLAVGVLDVKVYDDPRKNSDYAARFLQHMYGRCYEAAVCTFRSTFTVGNIDPHEAVFHPAHVYEMAKAVVGNGRVLLDDSYAPHVFTVAMYRGYSEWECMAKEFFDRQLA